MPFTDDAVFAEDPGLSWSQLRAFLSCARYRSFSDAATAIGLTSAAVRYQISLLEHRLEVRLFERRAGELLLTDAGASFAFKVEAPMLQLLAACAELTSSADDAAMTLTAPPLFAREFCLVQSSKAGVISIASSSTSLTTSAICSRRSPWLPFA